MIEQKVLQLGRVVIHNETATRIRHREKCAGTATIAPDPAFTSTPLIGPLVMSRLA
jgi:hypothetical protein